MKKAKYILIIFSVLIITGHLLILDYSNPGWSHNKGSYLGIVSMILVIAGVVISLIQEKAKK